MTHDEKVSSWNMFENISKGSLSTIPQGSSSTILEKKDNTITGSNWRTHQYYEILSVLDGMSKLDENDDFYVDPGIKDNAIYILSYLNQYPSIPLPQILPEGKDSLSLTWAVYNFKQFLTLYEDELESTKYQPETKLRCIEIHNFGRKLDLKALSNMMPGKAGAITAR
ncbi:hypothetical protein LZ686_00600 [Paracoccus sp. NFXS7]|uniref:hypothetical protein n=1 Tax=Paracoccus sp. NFXS7 TaxID=2908653 RepID=UPI0032DE74AB